MRSEARNARWRHQTLLAAVPLPVNLKKKVTSSLYIYDNQRTTSTNCKKAPSRYFAQSEVVLIVMTFSKKLFTMEGNAALSLRFFLS